MSNAAQHTALILEITSPLMICVMCSNVVWQQRNRCSPRDCLWCQITCILNLRMMEKSLHEAHSYQDKWHQLHDELKPSSEKNVNRVKTKLFQM